MAQNQNISANQITLIGILILGLLLAIFVGSLIGGTDYFTLGIIFGVIAAVIYITAFSQYWIWIAIVYAFLGFMIRPFGPSISPLNVSIALMLIFIFAFFWRKSSATESQLAIQHHFRAFRIWIVIYILYMAVQSLVSKYYPHSSNLISWGNVFKQNLEMWGPFLLVAVALKYAQLIRLPKHFGNWFAASLSIALLVNIIIRAYAIFVLKMGARDDLTPDPTRRYYSALSIEGINLTDDQYLLRTLAPFAILCGVAFLASRSPRINISGLLSGLLVFLGMIGAFFAGGRATVILAVFVPAFFLLAQRKISALLIGGAIAVIALVGIRYTYDVNYKLVPLMVQRSIALIPGMEMNEARDSIAGSSDWRWEVAVRAFDEWRSSPRTALIGRSVYAYTSEDITAMVLDPAEGTIRTSLLRGATHNTVTDLLLISGIVGLLLFYAVYFSVLWGVFCIYRCSPATALVGVLSFVFLIYGVTLFFSGVVSGGFFWNTGALFGAAIVVLAAQNPPDSASKSTIGDPSRKRLLHRHTAPEPTAA
jgi:hypothetical protein